MIGIDLQRVNTLIIMVQVPNYNGTSNGEYSKNGYFQWNSDLSTWINMVAY